MNKQFARLNEWILLCLGGLTKVVILIAVLPLVYAGDLGKVDPMPSPADQMVSIRQGATLYTTYCIGCHSAKAVTVNDLMSLGLAPEVLTAHGIDPKEGSAALKALMTPEAAQQVFGLVPPDLSLIVKQKSSTSIAGSDWIYTYLRSFYQDKQSTTGWNNVLYPGTKMPHILAGLQGVNEKQIASSDDASLSQHPVMKQVESGQLSTVEYDHAVADVVSYLEWMAEPTQHQRKRLGVWVLLFLGVFAILLWCLHAKYWKDIQ